MGSAVADLDLEDIVGLDAEQLAGLTVLVDDPASSRLQS